MLFDCTLRIVELWKLDSLLSSPASALLAKFVYYPKSFVVVLAIFTASSPGVDPIPRSHWQLLRCSVLSWDCSIVIPSSDSTSDSSSVSSIYLVVSSTEVLNPSESTMRAGISFIQSQMFMLIFLPLPMNHRCCSWHLEWWILSRRFSMDFTQIHQKNHCLW